MWVQRRLWRENTKQAQHWHQESLDVFRIIGDPWGRSKTLTSLAQESSAPLAVEVLGLPLHHAASHHETKDKAHQLLLLLSAHPSADVLTTIKGHWLEGTLEESLKKVIDLLQ